MIPYIPVSHGHLVHVCPNQDDHPSELSKDKTRMGSRVAASASLDERQPISLILFARWMSWQQVNMLG